MNRINSIDTMLDEININQEKGIFIVPQKIEKDLEKLLDRRIKVAELPLIVEEETYYKHGLGVKLGYEDERGAINHLIQYGLIRFDETDGIKKPLNTLSIAQVVSWIYQTQIQKILTSENEFNSPKFKSIKPENQIKILFNAYTGSHWFERFRKKFTKRAQTQDPRIVKEWDNISRIDFIRNYLTSNPRFLEPIKTLSEKGLLIPKNGKFIPSSRKNQLNTRGLGQLISLLYDKPLNEVFEPGNNPAARNLATRFLQIKVPQEIEKLDLVADKEYSLSKSAKLTQIPYDSLHNAVTNGLIPSGISPTEYYVIKGTDLAIYSISRQIKPGMKHSDLAELFGLETINLEDFGILVHESISRDHHVYPLFDTVVSIARAYLNQAKIREKRKIESINRNSIYIEVNNTSYQMTPFAQKRYRQEYNLPSFDSLCFEHIQEELATPIKFAPNLIITKELEIELDKTLITNVKIRKFETSYKEAI